MSDLSQFEIADDGEFDSFEWARGREKRVSIVLLLDNSGSMDAPGLDPRPIAQLNQALQRWTEVLHRDAALRYKAEIAVITFGKSGVEVHGDRWAPFTPAAIFEAPRLEAGGVTPMVEAIRTALSVLERRKRQIDAEGIPRVRPLVCLLTDGCPTDEKGHFDDSWHGVAAELERARDAKKLVLAAFGTDGADFDVLRSLAPGSALEIGSEDIYELLIEFSTSAAQPDPVEALRNAISRMATTRSQG